MAPLAASQRPIAGPGPAAPSSPCGEAMGGEAMGWRWPAGVGVAAREVGERWRGGDRSASAHPALFIAGHSHAGFHGF